MKSQLIYLVIATESCGAGGAVRAYVAKPEAEAFVARLEKHASREPRYPGTSWWFDGLDAAAQEAALAKYERQFDAWKRRHPAGKEWFSYSDFFVQECRLVGGA